MIHATYSTHKVSLLCYLHQQLMNFGTVSATNCHKYNHMSYIYYCTISTGCSEGVTRYAEPQRL